MRGEVGLVVRISRGRALCFKVHHFLEKKEKKREKKRNSSRVRDRGGAIRYNANVITSMKLISFLAFMICNIKSTSLSEASDRVSLLSG